MVKSKLQIPCQKVVSEGQTGVDRGALDACLHLNFPCGGWCPKDRLAEDGRISDKYPLKETAENEYRFRTLKNILDSDATMIISPEKLEGGTLLTYKYAVENKKSVLKVSSFNDIFSVFNWLIEKDIRVLNVAGPRLSEWSEAYYFSFQIIVGLVNEIKNRSDTHNLNS